MVVEMTGMEQGFSSQDLTRNAQPTTTAVT